MSVKDLKLWWSGRPNPVILNNVRWFTIEENGVLLVQGLEDELYAKNWDFLLVKPGKEDEDVAVDEGYADGSDESGGSDHS